MAGSINMSALPSICGAGPRFLLLTGFFIGFARQYFSSADNLVLDAWKTKLWTDDIKTTSIRIDDATLYDPQQIERRPGLMIRRNGFKGIKIGIDSGRAMGDRSLTGERLYTNVWQGSHTFFCVSRLPGEAEQLAYETWFALNSYAPAIRASFALVAIAATEVGTLGILKESAGQQWVVPVTIAYALQESWILQKTGPDLDQLDTQTTID